MVSHIIHITLVFSIVWMTSVYAKEPTNLSIVKQQLIRYHDSGQYEKDINRTVHEAMRYLTWRLQNPSYIKGKKPAIVIDIDETALSNYAGLLRLDFGGTQAHIRQAENQGDDPAIPSVLKLYQFAQSHDIAVFFITGRIEEDRDIAAQNLKNAGYEHWQQLILRNATYRHTKAGVYKAAMRKEITQQGYDILLNIGDQKSDLTGGYADKSFKLANPYYIIP